MKRKNSVLIVFILLGTLSFLPTHDFTSALTNEGPQITSSLNDDTDAFDHIYGNPGHTAMAVSEEDNLIFTNAYEGIAFIQLDDLANSTVYKEEIGLTDVQVSNIEVDVDLKLLYIGSIMGVDILNYSKTPLTATPLITDVATNFELGDFIDIDPETHFAWIVTQSHGLFIYDPYNDRFLDTTGYNLPDPSTSMLTVEVDSAAFHAFIGTKDGMFMLNTASNDTHWYSDAYPMPYNNTRVLKYYPSKGYLLMGTFQDVTGICGGLTVFDTSTYIFQETYNWTVDPYYPRAIYDIEIDLVRDIGYIVSGPGSVASNTESGLLVFDASTFAGLAKSAWGSLGTFGPPLVYGAPNYIESMIASIELDGTNSDLICGSVQLVQRITYTDPTSATTVNSPILGLLHNFATDVNYDPIDDNMYVSTLLGLDRVDPLTHDIEHLITGIGGAGGETCGELLVTARMFYHHRYYYDISGGTSGSMESKMPLSEYRYVTDISSSYNETLLYYSTAAQSGGLAGNGSMIIYNRITETFVVEDFGYNKSELIVNMIVQDPTEDVLYVGTGNSLILYNLTTLTEITRYGEGVWDVRSLEWINGDLWVGLGDAPYIYLFHPETGLYDTFSEVDKILYPSINDIYYHDDGNEVYISANSGLYVYNLTNSMLKYESEAEDLSTLFTSAAAYCEITDEVYIGSFQGVNIYDPLFDDKLPEIEIDGFVTLTGNFAFEASGKDYSGVKNVTVEFWNATVKKIWSILSDFLSINFDTTQYDDGTYTITTYVTDYNDLLNTTSQVVTIENVVIGEYTALTALFIFPVVACIVYLNKRKR